jgi:carboxymethylenebutenolidase
MDQPTGMISFPSDGRTTPGYLARPAGAGPFPALVVIQEWWGLVPHIKEVADRFAAAGFVALAPDLYHGEAALEPDEARKLAMALDRGRAVSEIRAAVGHLAGLAEVSPKQVGVVGWCMGGGLALASAAEEPGIGAVVTFYGRPLASADTARLKAPVLGLYGEHDQGIPPEAARAFAADCRRFDVPHEIHIYPGAAHAFFNDSRPAYDPEAAADSWERTLGWFRRHLAGNSGAQP